MKTETLLNAIAGITPPSPILLVVGDQAQARCSIQPSADNEDHRVTLWWPALGLQSILSKPFRIVIVSGAAIARSKEDRGTAFTRDWREHLRHRVQAWGEQGLYVEGL